MENENSFEDELRIDIKTTRQTQKMYRTPLNSPNGGAEDDSAAADIADFNLAY